MDMSKLLRLIILSSLALFAGCFQASSDDIDFRTVPVTNNPYVVPNHGGGLPGGGGSPSGAY
jgi:hypothetical protein